MSEPAVEAPDAVKALKRAARNLGVTVSMPVPGAYRPAWPGGRPDLAYPAEVPWSPEPHAILRAPWLPAEIPVWVYSEDGGGYAIDHRELLAARILTGQRPGLEVRIILISRGRDIRLAPPEEIRVTPDKNFLPSFTVQQAEWASLADVTAPPVRRADLALAH